MLLTQLRGVWQTRVLFLRKKNVSWFFGCWKGTFPFAAATNLFDDVSSGFKGKSLVICHFYVFIPGVWITDLFSPLNLGFLHILVACLLLLVHFLGNPKKKFRYFCLVVFCFFFYFVFYPVVSGNPWQCTLNESGCPSVLQINISIGGSY